jgi:predicted metal-dependent peptidase
MTTLSAVTAAPTKKKSAKAEKVAKQKADLQNLVGPTDSKIDAAARERIVTSRVGLLIRHSFFGNLATRLKLTNADEWLPTAATDGVHLYYNSRFIMKLNPKEVDFLIAHEILHLVYDHIGRRETRDPQIWNIAADYCVNADLKKHSIGEFITTVPCLYDAKYTDMSSEEVYDDLMKNAQKIDISELLDQILDEHLDGEDSEGDGGDEDSQGNKKGRVRMTKEQRDQMRQEMKQHIINAAKQAAEAGHGVPGNVSRLVKELAEPTMPWQEMIQTVLTSAIRTDYSFMRPSRRSHHFDAIMPSRSPGEEIEISVAIDTSGSISNGELSVFLAEIQSIMDTFDGYKIKVFSFDTEVHNPKEFTSDNLEDISEYEPVGGGGTDFQCIFQYLKNSGEIPTRLIVFTDGHTWSGWGDPDLCDTCWVIWGDSKKSITPPFGTWAHFA